MIDWPRVRQLQDDVGAEDFDEVIELFLEEVEAVTARLEQIEDRNRIGDDLHFLKGSAINLGFEHFSQHCHAGEVAAANGDAASINIAEILECYAQSKQMFLVAYVDELSA